MTLDRYSRSPGKRAPITYAPEFANGESWRRSPTDGDGFSPAPDNPTWDLLNKIDPDRRDAFLLMQLAGMSYAEAATVLNSPVGTIRSRVARAGADLLDEVRATEAC